MPKMSVNQSSSQFNLREEDVIRLILEFLSNRDLSISQLSVERETGLTNGIFSDDLLFLRQLILDGQWDDVLQFIQPLESIESFDKNQFKYLVNKHKYIELLCIRSEAGPLHNVEIAVNDVVECLNHLEQLCPNKDDYNELCLLLTIPNLSEQKEYKNWNPSNWRISCFKSVLPLIEKYLPVDKKSANALAKKAKGDRLMQLIIKGILYESCVDYCQQKATSVSTLKQMPMKYSSLLEGMGFSNSDLSLLSWLQSIPPDIFSHPFEQKTLNVEVEQLEKPSLMASWSEVILVTPIKPKVFPHSATPFTRRKASDLMSKSLTPGIVDGLTKSVMNFSITDMTAMSRSSFATTGFHLNSTNGTDNSVNNSNNNSLKKVGQTSVDRLFEEGDVFSSSCFQRLPTISEKPSPVSTVSIEECKLLNETVNSIHSQPLLQSHNMIVMSAKDVNQSQNTPDLWQKFQREKQKLLEKLLKEEEEMFLCGTAVPSVIANRENTFQNSFSSVMQTPIIYNEVNPKLTPVNQMGQSNYPNPERLTTSTPKGSLYRIRETPSFVANQSPIFGVNNQNGSQQKNISFNNSVNELLTTHSNIASHQSSQQSHQLSAQSSQLANSPHQQNVSNKSVPKFERNVLL